MEVEELHTMIILILNYLKVQSLHKHTINLVIVMTNNILFAMIQKDSIYIKNSETQNSIQSQNNHQSLLSQVPVPSQQIFKKQPSFVSKQKQEPYIYIYCNQKNSTKVTHTLHTSQTPLIIITCLDTRHDSSLRLDSIQERSFGGQRRELEAHSSKHWILHGIFLRHITHAFIQGL